MRILIEIGSRRAREEIVREVLRHNLLMDGVSLSPARIREISQNIAGAL